MSSGFEKFLGRSFNEIHDARQFRSESLAREEEREMIPFREERNVALAPYSPPPSGLFCRSLGEIPNGQKRQKRPLLFVHLYKFKKSV